MASESIAHEAEGRIGYWLGGHEGERYNCFSKIQLVGQNWISRQNNFSYSLRQKSSGHFNQTLFFPFSCSPRPSQSCLSRFGPQILYTNIEGTRRPQSVPTILSETVVKARL